MRVVAVLCLCALGLWANIEVINGKTTIVTLDGSPQKLMLDAKEIPPLAHPKDASKKIALLPIPYRQKETMELLHVKEEKHTTIALHVKQGNYTKEQLSVDAKKVKPPQSVKERISKEYQEAMAIYQTHTPQRYWKEPFELPMQSKITSVYGTARIYNDTLKSFHSGTDFRAAVGTPIQAVNDGVVVLAKERYYAGGSILLDHGEGIYSCYYHLSKMPVTLGQKVRKGDVLGLSGQSGRVTGPHLHFAFMVQGVQVDPLDFMEKINGLFEGKGVQLK